MIMPNFNWEMDETEQEREIYEELMRSMGPEVKMTPEEIAEREREEKEAAELPDYFVDEQTGIPYRREGDYFIPDLRAEEIIPARIGVYGRERWRFLKENRPEVLDEMIADGNANEVLAELNELAKERVEVLTEELAKADPAPDKMKRQLEWVAHMNMLKAQAEEIMRAEMIYV